MQYSYKSQGHILAYSLICSFLNGVVLVLKIKMKEKLTHSALCIVVQGFLLCANIYLYIHNENGFDNI